MALTGGKARARVEGITDRGMEWGGDKIARMRDEQVKHITE